MSKVLNVWNKLINGFVSLLIIIALLYSSWGLIDVGSVYIKASSHFTFGKNDNKASLADYIAKNPDICALLEIPGTGIKYPVVQGKTNEEYLNKNVEGECSVSGSIFIDTNNSREFTDKYTLFYGHRMEASAMFGDITRFADKAYFNNHKSGTLTLLDGEHEIVFFACSRTLSNNALLFSVETAKANIDGLIQEINHTAVQKRDVNVEKNDKILAFSTCESSTTSGRIILFGLLKGE